MSRNVQWVPGARRRAPSQLQDQGQQQTSAFLEEHALSYDAYEAKHMFDTRRNRLAKNFLSASRHTCGLCRSRVSIPARWLPPAVVLVAGVALTCSVWLSEDSSLAGLRWPWSTQIPAPAVSNVILLLLSGVSYLFFGPHTWRSNVAAWPLMPLRAKTVIWLFWIALNLVWFIAGILEHDFRKPSWLKQTRVASRAQHFSEPMLRLLRLLYGVGMASAWPLLANLAVVLLPVDRGLFLLACLGAGHEEGVLAHALCGTAVWVWAAAHALLTQAPMLAAGLWRLIVLPSADGAETKATANFMGLLAFLSLCGLGLSSLARLRRIAFNSFQVLHLVLAPAVLLFGCLHKGTIFWYSMFGAVLYGADLVQRWLLRRRAAAATATVYPLAPQHQSPPPSSNSATGLGPAGRRGGVAAGSSVAHSEFVVLRIPTAGCPPGCLAGQHVFLQVPAVSRWEWHPYSVAAHDQHSFAVVVKAGGDWERRLCRLAAVEAAAAGSHSARLDVVYEGLYGTSGLQTAAAAADRVLLFAGGAGITPVASVLQALLAAGAPTLLPNSEESPQQRQKVQQQKQQPQQNTSKSGKAFSPAQDSPVTVDVVVNGQGAEQLAQLPRTPWATASEGSSRLWPAAASGAFATEAAAEVLDAEEDIARGGARVHLVWAVTQQSDAQPLQPLLRAAAARGCRVDVHCTRLPPELPAQVAIACNGDKGTGLAGAAPAAPHSKAGDVTAADIRGARGAGRRVVTRAPWQIHGAACWGVAAAAALLGAAGANLGGTAASTHSCKVPGPGFMSDDGVVDWTASVRAAFSSSRTEATGAAATSRVGRLLAALLQGSAAASVFSCPSAQLPTAEHLHARPAVGQKAAQAGIIRLRVCRTWGSAAPHLCVKCDPFKGPGSELEVAWPCCQARVCFFASRLAPLVGWVAGVLLGAALACLVWRWWSGSSWTAGQAPGRRRLLLASRGARSWLGADSGRLGYGVGAADSELSAGLLANGEQTAAAATAPGLEAVLSAVLTDADGQSEGMGFDPLAQAPGAVGNTAEDLAKVTGIRVHEARPDVDAYIRAAAAAGDAAGCGRYGRAVCGDEVYGVVVCGPESLQAAVQAAYVQHVQKVYPESWFRGFSFTT